MQMAELNDLQKKMLSGPQKQLKDITKILKIIRKSMKIQVFLGFPGVA